MTGLMHRARRALALRLCPPLGAELVALAAEVQAHKGAVRIAERAAQGKEALVQRLRAAEEWKRDAEAVHEQVAKERDDMPGRVRAAVARLRSAAARAQDPTQRAEIEGAIRLLSGAPANLDPDPRQGTPGGADLLPAEPGGWITWLVVRQLETAPPEVFPFRSLAEAEDFYDRAQMQWTGVYLCRILRAADRPHDQQPAAAPPPPAAPQVRRYGLPQCTCASGTCAMHDGVFKAPAAPEVPAEVADLAAQQVRWTPVEDIAPDVRRHRWARLGLNPPCLDCEAIFDGTETPCPGPKGGDDVG